MNNNDKIKEITRISKEIEALKDKSCENLKVTYIRCVGVDGKIHECDPSKDVCRCGIKVLKKRLDRDDYKRFDYYKCTY